MTDRLSPINEYVVNITNLVNNLSILPETVHSPTSASAKFCIFATSPKMCHQKSVTKNLVTEKFLSVTQVIILMTYRSLCTL